MNILAKKKKADETTAKRAEKRTMESVVFDKEKSTRKKKHSANTANKKQVQKESMVQDFKEKEYKTTVEESFVQEQDFKKEKVDAELVSEKEQNFDQPKYQRAYFFPRFLAYVLDFIIVTMLSTLVLNMVPQDKNYKAYLNEYQKIQAEFMAQDITPEEYVNKSVDVIYDLDYSNVLPMIVEVIILILYYIVFQFYNKGQTLGKKLLRIRVVSNNYEDATMDQFILRSFVVPSIISKMAIIALVLFMGRETYYYGSFTVQGIQVGLIIISVFMIMYSKSGRGLHDRLAKTTVIMVD